MSHRCDASVAAPLWIDGEWGRRPTRPTSLMPTPATPTTESALDEKVPPVEALIRRPTVEHIVATVALIQQPSAIAALALRHVRKAAKARRRSQLSSFRGGLGAGGSYEAPLTIGSLLTRSRSASTEMNLKPQVESTGMVAASSLVAGRRGVAPS